MRRLSQLSYQTKLLLAFFLLGMIPSVSIGATAYFKSVDTLERRANEDLGVIANQLNEAIGRQVEDVDRFSTFPYFTPEIFRILNEPYLPRDQWSYRDIEAQQQFAKLLMTYPSIFSTIQGLIFYSNTGNVYGYRVSDRSSINEEVSPRQEPWYVETQERKGGVRISGLRTERQFNGSPFSTITVSRQLLDNKFEPAGVVAIDISPGFIGQIVRSFRLNNMHVLVADENGKLIYSSSSTGGERFLQDVTDQAAKPGRKERPGRLITVPPAEGRTDAVTGVYSHSEYLGWTTYLLLDRSELLRDANVIRNFTVGILVLFAAASALTSLLLARGLARPIRQLIASMRNVERGVFQPPQRAKLTGELGQLQLSYGRMVRRLDSLIRSIEEKETQKKEAELYALRARITPHFLFNTLNSIRMLAVLQQSGHIAKLLQSLNKLIRANMKLERELVPLEAELDLLAHYVQLMELRYSGTFKVEWEIEPSAAGALVPPMILQPLLENAIFHGSFEISREMTVVVGAGRDADNGGLRLRVSDDGRGMDSGLMERLNSGHTGDSAQEGIGLGNVRERIRLRFGPPYSLHVHSEPGNGTSVELYLPFLTEKGRILPEASIGTEE